MRDKIVQTVRRKKKLKDLKKKIGGFKYLKQLNEVLEMKRNCTTLEKTLAKS